MFDVSWSEFLILGIVALIVVGPKELPALMRTLGRYAGMARRQAAEFRSHFDDAMREAEMADLRKELDGVRRDALSAAREAREKAAAEIAAAQREAKDGTSADTSPAPASASAEPEVPSGVAPSSSSASADGAKA